MGEPSTLSRAQAIEGFAAVLAELRRSVGNPSFRVMAGRSRVISHTTLHEAAQGNRLPSWGDHRRVRQSVRRRPGRLPRAVGRGPNQAVAWCPSTGPHEHLAAADASAARARRPGSGSTSRSDPRRNSTPRLTAADPAASPAPRRRRHLLLAAAAAVMLTSGIAVAWAVAGHAKPTTPSAPPLVAADCPVHQQNPPPAPPEHAGDRSSFVADLTLPDCEHVAAAHDGHQGVAAEERRHRRLDRVLAAPDRPAAGARPVPDHLRRADRRAPRPASWSTSRSRSPPRARPASASCGSRWSTRTAGSPSPAADR